MTVNFAGFFTTSFSAFRLVSHRIFTAELFTKCCLFFFSSCLSVCYRTLLDENFFLFVFLLLLLLELQDVQFTLRNRVAATNDAQ